MTTNPEPESVYSLAFETSSALGGVALGLGGEVLGVRKLSGPRKHAVEFLPAIAALCNAHAIEPTSVRRVFVSSGPGSFTGLRIGITTARMIGLATGASIVAVPTLEVIAQNALDASYAPDRVVVMLDAKRQRVYTAVFCRRGGRYVATTDPVEADPAEILAGQTTEGESYAVLGEGALYHRAAIEGSGWPVLPESLYAPRAETVYRLGVLRAREGKFEDRRRLIPTYIRPPEAQEKWEQRQKKRQS